MKLKRSIFMVMAMVLAGSLIEKGNAFPGEEAEVSTSYGKHGLTFESEEKNFSLSLGARLQFRYTLEDLENRDDLSSFQVKRGKIFASGHAFTKNLKYKIQVNAAGSAVTLEDFYGDYKVMEGLSIQAGQYKVPFNRQELTSSGSQQFVDRAITNEAYALNRDQGIMFHSFLLNDYFEYALGIFNGNGRNKSANENNGHLYCGRVVLYPFGKFKMYSESDIEHTEKPKAGFGFAGAYNTKVPFEVKENDQTLEFIKDVTALTVDGIIKWYGFSLLGDYFMEKRDVRNGSSTDSAGFNAQAGMFIIPEHLEIALRYAQVDPDVDESNNTESEIAAGINYFIEKHNLKLQSDFALLTVEKGNSKEIEKRLRIQLQFIL